MKWINVKKKLPFEIGEYLIYTYIFNGPDNSYPSYEIIIDYWNGKKWRTNENATHWMPLPKEPGENE